VSSDDDEYDQQETAHSKPHINGHFIIILIIQFNLYINAKQLSVGCSSIFIAHTPLHLLEADDHRPQVLWML